MVLVKAAELLSKVPPEFVPDEYDEAITKMGGLGIPLNIFLLQEIQRLQKVIQTVCLTLEELQHALKGEVVITPDILNAINAIYDAKVPTSWMYGSGGDEISWISATLGIWFLGLLDRYTQLCTWLNGGPRVIGSRGTFSILK